MKRAHAETTRPGRLSFDQHRRIGRDVKQVVELLNRIHAELYPHTKRIGKKAMAECDKARAAVSQLKCQLDNVVFIDCPERTHHEKARCYYGGFDEPEEVS